MVDESKRQPERPDFSTGMEPRCPACDVLLVIDLDEQSESANYRCPNGHTDDPLGEAEVGSRSRQRVGELGEDS